MAVTITKTITEHTNGKRLNSVTGKWERRVGTKTQPGDPNAKSASGRRSFPVTVWEETDPPRTVVYNSPEHEESGIRGGTVHTIVQADTGAVLKTSNLSSRTYCAPSTSPGR